MLSTSIQFSSWHLHGKLKTATHANEYSLYTINPYVYMMCEMLQQCRYTGHNVICLMLTDILPNISSCSLFNVCITNPEQIRRNIRISNDKQSSRFNQYLSYNNMKQYLCTSWGIWHIKKSRINSKLRSGLCLPLANRMSWRTADVCWLCVHCVYCGKWNKWQRHFTYHLFSWTAGIITTTLLVIWLYL
jgi:hypothetical protein